MRRILIDSEGEAFLPTPSALSSKLGVGRSDFDLITHAVRNLGYVELRLREGRMTVIARPALVSPVTLAGAADAICRLGARRVALVIDAPHPTTPEIFAGAGALIAKLGALCEAASMNSGWSSYTTTALKMERLSGSKYAAMHLLVAEWRLLEQRMDQEMLREFLRREMPANAALLTRSHDGESIVFLHSRFLERSWTSDWMRNAAGLDFRNHIDRAYADWASRAYKEVLAHGRPRLERVKAKLRCPEFGPRDFEYDRLILPWLQADGETVATLVSVVRTVRVG